ncbi:MAG: hypothetical protein JRH11_02055 [Deltaproteobacteria bacterium]|nr:hypothetical protein [Deltaproteobacteria bacterium]
MRTALILTLVLLSALTTACGGGPRGQVMSAVEASDLELAIHRYERYRAAEGADPGLLAQVAALLLEDAAAADDEGARRAALAQLGLAGTAGRESLRRLAQPGRDPVLRARALELLAKGGDGAAQEQLRALLDAERWEILAAAVSVLEGSTDEGLLLAYL